MYNKEKIIKMLHDIHDESIAIPPYVVIAQPRRSNSEVAAQKLNGHDGLHIDLMGFSHGFIDVYGEKVDVARNYLIERALETDAKYLFFVGDDTVSPYDAFKVLHKTAEENPNSIVTGVYYIKCSDAMIMVKTDNGIIVPNVDPGQVIEAWQTGMDCMLIPISILRKMKEEEPELPFTCVANNIDGIPFVGEDNFFVHRIRKMGVKLLVNTDVQCLHVDLATGKYTAHPDVDLKKYYMNFEVTDRLTLDDKDYIDNRWVSRLPAGSNSLSNKIIEMTNNNIPVKFNMGCGTEIIPGYFNVDKYSKFADIQEDVLTANIPENCADEIRSFHMIEHLPKWSVNQLLSNWHNILKTGGKLVLEMPDLEKLCKAYLDNEEDRDIITLCIYGSMYNCLSPETEKNGTSSTHLYGYNPAQMIEILNKIGFTKIEEKDVEGEHPGHNFRIEAIK